MLSVAILHGSDSDLPQMKWGLERLAELKRNGTIAVKGVHMCSVHRMPEELITALLPTLIWIERVQYIIAGAGKANHLSGMVDRLLRNWFLNDTIRVIPVAFAPEGAEVDTLAWQSVVGMPEHDMVTSRPYIGAQGFTAAVERLVSIETESFLPIVLTERSIVTRNVAQALAKATEMAQQQR